MNSVPLKTDNPSSRPIFSAAALPRLVALVLLFASAATVEARNLCSLSALSNGDIWWHLRTGIWILQNHAVPHRALFSQSPEIPWGAASWGYDLKLALFFQLLGLRSLPVLLMSFKVALAVVTFLLAGGLRGRLWPAIAFSAIAQYILAGVPPGPGYCSILLFGVELLLLNESRRSGSIRTLLWLPLLFWFWANLDIQFVYGILLLSLFLTTSLLQDQVQRAGAKQLQRHWTVASPRNMGILAMLCGIAALLTPYSYHLYGAFSVSLTSAANRYILDLHGLGFRRTQDYTLLLLAMGGFLALGLRRSRNLFQIALLVGCTMLSFHAQRDAWFAVLAAVGVIGEAMRDNTTEGLPGATGTLRGENRQVLSACGFSVAITMLAAVLLIPRSNEALMAKVAQTYPVAACNYVREHQLPPPLFNSYEWGGFLTWYLPAYPVAIDSRAGLYDEDFVAQYFRTMNAEAPYQSYTAISQARTLLLPRGSMMADVLSSMAGFRVAYSDNVAVVLNKE